MRWRQLAGALSDAPNNKSGGLIGLGKTALGSIPPSMLVLAVIVGLLLWHETQQDALRSQVIQRLLDHCFAVAPGTRT